jgi:dihydroflavonol-4-reductase
MKAFVTGATGFIGNQVARLLIERGYDTWLLVRTPARAEDLAALGAHLVQGDINDVDAMREAMRGSDVVFHLAGWYKIGVREPGAAWHTNVDGTAHVLALAHDLGVPRIVYASTVAVFGDTGGRLADENYVNPGLAFPTEYDRTKWVAHYKVALPLIQRGAPLIVVMPGGVFGPGDNSIIGDAMRLFWRGRLPALPGTDTLWTYAYVDDIAQGIVLAAERGRPGESYILAGPALSMGEVADEWSRVSGRAAPQLRVASRFVRPWAPLLDLMGQFVPLPPLLSGEAARDTGTSYLASADKARRELGWSPRPVEDGLKATFAALGAQDAVAAVARPGPGETARGLWQWNGPAGRLLAGAAAVAVLAAVIGLGSQWLTRRGRPKR